eukprot:2190743-Rhodomonas_salina.1
MAPIGEFEKGRMQIAMLQKLALPLEPAEEREIHAQIAASSRSDRSDRDRSDRRSSGSPLPS